jgi:multidrug efflux pump subunit AcrA (membrane-fusion protein)
MKVRHVLIILTSIIIVALIVAAFSIGQMMGMNYGVENAEEIRAQQEEAAKADGEPEQDTSKYLVNAKPVFNESRPITANGFGQVTSSSMINITSEVQGEINANILLKKGTSFKQGQVLFTINNSDVKMALKARKSSYLMLMTNVLPDLKLDFPDNFEAWLEFFNKIDVEKKLPPLPETKTFKEKNFIVSKSVLTEYYSIQSEEERLKKYVITAPFSGSVLNAFTDDGAIINPGSPVIAVIREGNLEIEVPISNVDIDMVQIGAEVSLYDENGSAALGKVARKGTYVNANTQTVPVFIEIMESDLAVYNGMYLDASIACEGVENIVELPRKAIFNKNEVYVVRDGKIYAEALDIKLFLAETVLVKGMKDGTLVVMEPLINAKEEMEVELLNAKNN